MLEKIQDFLWENYDIEKDEVLLSSELINDLGLTSFQLMEMCAQIEAEYDIEISEDRMLEIVSVEDFITAVKKELKAGETLL